MKEDGTGGSDGTLDYLLSERKHYKMVQGGVTGRKDSLLAPVEKTALPGHLVSLQGVLYTRGRLNTGQNAWLAA